MPQGQSRGSGDGEPDPRTESRAAALSLKTQTWLGRRKSASGASDLEAFRSDEQLQYCTDHSGTEATTASDLAVSQPEHRTGTSTTEYRHSDMRFTIAEMRSNRALSAYSSLLIGSCCATLTKFLFRVASACEFSFCSSLYEKKGLCDPQPSHCGLRQHTSKKCSSVMNLIATTLEMGRPGEQKEPEVTAQSFKATPSSVWLHVLWQLNWAYSCHCPPNIT